MPKPNEKKQELELKPPVEIPARTYEQCSDKLRAQIGKLYAGMQTHELQDAQYVLCRMLDDCDTEAKILERRTQE